LKLNPDLVEAHYNLGLAFAALGDQTAAIEEYRTTVRLQPDNAQVYFHLGIALQSPPPRDPSEPFTDFPSPHWPSWPEPTRSLLQPMLPFFMACSGH